MFKKVLVTTLLMAGLLAGSAFAIDLDFTGYISDQANLLSEQSLNNLNYTLHDLNKKTGASIALVTMSTLKGQKIEQLASDIMGEYKIGDDNKKNGIVFLISIGERQLQLIVGDGLINRVQPKQLEDIVDKNVLPYFEAAEYENGILRGTYLIADAVAAVDNQKLQHYGDIPELKKENTKNSFNKNWLWWFILPVAAVIGCIIAFFCVKQKDEQ